MAERWTQDVKPFLAKWALVAVPYLWSLLFFLAPFLIIFKISLSQTAIAMPPYVPVIGGLGDFLAKLSDFTFDNYVFLTEDPLYYSAYLSSLRIALVSTILLLIVGYPIAYGMARAPKSLRNALVMAVILPFWTSFLIRVYAWIGILKPEGLITIALQSLGILGPDEQIHVYNTEIAVFIGIVYSYLPFMVLPLYAALEKLDATLLEAAADLGCPPTKSFWVITFPLSLPGVIAGCFLCFIPIVGEFVIPDLLGGSETLMIGKTLWAEFFNNRDWPVSSAVAVVLLIILVVPIVIFQNQQKKA
ncbi:ABC transporter permease subunit [Pleomorphomonas sp. NRK KF1]|uniref:ABC transporter permease subunit n=1 Tax=Pleomorphomonas sp. NRK KF1 TaxID=2943000 RepID=UPI00204450BE|nr:ABC transporter permease subunit [Pleomorphomonas sp. NRK KF1]MCM5553254.1 ABC transporter permease subunit [Pleomorphomonas sp. NRK KF1]